MNTAAPVLLPPERPGFAAGMRHLAGGFTYLLRTPRVVPLAAVPAAIALVLTIALGVATVQLVPSWIESLLGTGSGVSWAVLVAVAKIAGTLIALFASLAIAFGLAQPLSGPALDRIVRHAEADMGAPAWPPTSLLDDVLRAVQTQLIGYAISLPILAVLLVVGMIFPPAVVITFPLKLLVVTALVAWDICDYPLSIRGVAVRTRLRFMQRNFKAMLGFGVALALLSVFLPCTLLLVLPAGVAGAARLIVQIERWEAAASPQRLPVPQIPPLLT
jgi:CysZ protein